MSEKVWISEAYKQTSLNIYFKDLDEKLTYEQEAETCSNVQKGVEFDWDLLPERMVYSEITGKMPSTLPPLFLWGYIFISKKIYDLVSHLNFGKTHFFPVRIYDENQEFRPDFQYYGVALAESKATVVPGELFEPMPGAPNLFRLPPFPIKDQQAILIAGFTPDVDLWVDPRIRGPVFMTDRLWAILRVNQSTRFFKARSCLANEG